MKPLCLVALLVTLPVSALDFDELIVPGLDVGPVNAITGRASPNCRLADFDGDGDTDLLLPTALILRTDNRFAVDHPIVPPGADSEALCDLWKDRLYLQQPDAWRVIRFQDGDWVDEFIIEQHGPSAAPGHTGSTPVAPTTGKGLRFARFLYDFDVNGQPEIVQVREDGVHILRVTDEGVSELALLNVLPPLSLMPPERQVLWPPGARHIQYPTQHLDCRLIIDATSIRVITRDTVSDGRVRYRIVPYRIDSNTWTVFADQRNVHETPPMPGYMQPCRLNEDGVLDYAGGDWEFSSARILPAPVHQTAASTDGGVTIQSVRTQSYTPQTMFVDFDGDDDLDMITTTSGLFQGGVRESLNRYANARTIRHRIEVLFQSSEGIFSDTADVQANFEIELDEAPLQHGEMFRKYQASQLFNVTGDLSGDGVNDFVVRTRPDRIVIYVTRPDGVPGSPDKTIQVAPSTWRFGVADVDGDSLADLVVQEAGDTAATVYFTRGTAS